MIGRLNTKEIIAIRDILSKYGINTSEEKFEYNFDKRLEYSSDITFDIESSSYDGGIKPKTFIEVESDLESLYFIDQVFIDTYKYKITIELAEDYIIKYQGDILESARSIMLFDQFTSQKMNEDGDGGGGDFGGDFSAATPSNTPGMGNPDPGGGSGDSPSNALGSGDTWGFAQLFPNYMGPKKRKKKKSKRKKRNAKK